MNRTTRSIIVVAIALVVASVATYLVFIALKNRPAVQVEVAHAYQVVAAKPLAVGMKIGAGDVKLVPWPAAAMVPGGFTKVEDVVDRGVVSAVAENEPLNANNVASKEAGAGLAPLIPAGMRAITLRVNEVLNVAGYVVPGTRVDVMVILRDATGSMARVVVNNVEVLAADTQIDSTSAKDGKSIPSRVVTVLVTPEDAARIALASLDGQIMLTLRNPLDSAPAAGGVMRTSNLRGDSAPAPAPSTSTAPPVRRAVAPPPPPPPPAPKPYTVETIRAAKRGEETVK